MSSPINSTSQKVVNTALSLPPDGYSRFFVIVRILQEIFGTTNETLAILDVGGCSPYLYECLADSGIKFELTIVDILPKPENLANEANYIQADITKSKLSDNSFDVVVSTDVLEHVPEELKDEFVKSAIRLSKKLVIIAAPFDTEGVDEAEHMINGFNKKLFGVGQAWLEEHFKYSKPSVDNTAVIIDKLNVPYAHFGVNNLYSWIFGAHLNLIQAKIGLDEGSSKHIMKSYNQRLSESIEFTEPTYRHFFVVFKDKKLVRKNILRGIATQTNTEAYGNYIHGMMDSIFEQIRDLKMSIDVLKETTVSLEQKLRNEKIHTLKVQNELNTFKNNQVKNTTKNLRHPRSVAKSLVRKVMK